jgi:hypothetical protein
MSTPEDARSPRNALQEILASYQWTDDSALWQVMNGMKKSLRTKSAYAYLKSRLDGLTPDQIRSISSVPVGAREAADAQAAREHEEEERGST